MKCVVCYCNEMRKVDVQPEFDVQSINIAAVM